MSAAFYAVFGVFVVLMLGLAVVSVRWAVRRDRAAREARREHLRPEEHRASSGARPCECPAGWRRGQRRQSTARW